MTSGTRLPLAAILLLVLCPVRAAAETLKITSNPSGATVEMDGVLAGTTPFAAAHVGATDSPSSPTRADGSAAMTAASNNGKTQQDSNTSLPIAQTAGASSEPFASQPPHGFGTVAITSEPDDAEIYVDDKFVGNAPAKLKLAAGNHIVVMKAPGFAEWKRALEILKDSQVTLQPVLDRAP
jgi:hypothetical protein